MRRYFFLALIPLLAMTSGCALWRGNFQNPEVYLTRIAPLPGEGLEQRFAIGLRIVNPNRTPLAIRGMSYGLTLMGEKIVSGVTADIADIPAYGVAEVELQAAANLLGAVRLVSTLISRPAQAIDYALEARLDLRGFLIPLRIAETGSIQLGQSPGNSGENPP